ncbi:hypothetical protein MBLNU459_g4154t2 [Dothideomycetes sp. NU459]
MGVPFEALLPYAVMLGFFGITGAGLSKIRNMQNGGKRARHSEGADDDDDDGDEWETQEPDTTVQTRASYILNRRSLSEKEKKRLTGFLRGQTDRPTAPAGFELSNGWRVEKGVM